MMLTFAETHNMIVYLSKSDASEGFNQIIDFLDGSSIKYALTVNPNIYVSCIKQYWTSVAVKKVNDVMRLQALVDKKKIDEGDVEVNVDDVSAAGIVAEGVISAADDEVPTAGRMIADMDTDVDVTLKDVVADVKDVAAQDANIDESVDVQGRKAESQAQIYQIDLEHANKKEDKAVKRYQALKRKPQTESKAKKNMMIYLRNVAGFKMDYFKGMIYNDIRPIFEKHFDLNVDFLLKTKEQMDEEDSRALKRLNESQEDKAAKKQKLDEEVEE
nr:hypothetical protein [Tanacetum cinerariifolium]GEY86176.1 hypothetical protein [Tanacetum cinerariifolium]